MCQELYRYIAGANLPLKDLTIELDKTDKGRIKRKHHENETQRLNDLPKITKRAYVRAQIPVQQTHPLLGFLVCLKWFKYLWK